MLVAARLVTSDEGVLEITHEALARAWPRLRGWLDDDVEGQRIRHHLSGAADAWDTPRAPRQRALPRGPADPRAGLAVPHRDRPHRRPSASSSPPPEAASEAEERSAAERARAQARLIRRLRIVLGGAAVLLVLALVAGGVAAVQSNRADRQRRRGPRRRGDARQAAVSADARRVGARSQLTDDISLSLLLAAAGARLDDSPETRVNLLDRAGQAAHAGPVGAARRRLPGGHGRQSATAAGSPPPTIRTGCTSTTPPPTGCCAATTPAGLPRTSRRS